MTSARSYIIGYILSVILTLLAPALLWLHIYNHHRFPTHPELYAAAVVLAVLQLVVQLVFFLHIGRESGPRWRLMALFFAIVIVFIVAGGALWIMQDLNGRMMPDQAQMLQYMSEQDGGI
ncbi:MAG TPA: cytochrome o ubiquinol oxidase subunit IV [Candidatus Paceibacterota bacterium]|nr:cytochrome o ubiquinol oxidase subunit IV [Candidatus Paceibacterota bacterium]